MGGLGAVDSQAFGAVRPPSSFDRLRLRATFDGGSVEFLILSLSKDEEFDPRSSTVHRT
jgi:hypothetical protein